MNHLDLFSGIGGFALGAEWAGVEFEHSFYSDIDAYANKVYAKNFPDAIALGDITKIDGNELKATYGNEWIITGGFPCQDISIAGKGAGLAGARSGLWFEMWRLISELRPRFVIAENVGALTFRGLNAVLASLAEIGYDAEWQDIRASDVGAPHKRERIWIVAYPQSQRQTETRCRGKRSEEWAGKCSAISRDTQSPRFTGGTERQGKEQHGRTSAWLSWGSKHWTSIAPELCRVGNGLPEELDAIECLGNSVVPLITELLFRQIKQLLEQPKP